MKLFMSREAGSASGGKKIIYLIPVLVIALLIVGYFQFFKKSHDPKSDQTAGKSQQENKNTKQNETSKTDSLSIVHGAKLAGTRIELENIKDLKPGEIELSFKLFGLDAHEFGPDDLKISYEKQMHLMLIRDDVQFYQHLHPEYTQGKWIVKTQVPEQGSYEMYVDVDPKEEKPVILRVPLTIGGATVKKMFPEINRDLTANVDGIVASLDKTELEKKTKEVKLKFKLTQNGQVINQVDSYLGALGHVVVLKHGNPDHFVHAHSLDKTVPLNGLLEFESEFQEAGMYTIFAQFSINGQITTFPITLERADFDGVKKTEENKHMD